MLEILQFYVSGFWIWVGITTGLGILVKGFVALVVGAIGAITGSSVHIGDTHN